MAFTKMRRGDVPRLSHMLGAAFGFPEKHAPRWLEGAGHENVRILREGNRITACLIVIPMGHFFGGRSVSTIGIAGVAVALEARGRGAGREIMDETVREGRANGFALSTLYPATQALYRRSGYERAGKLCEARVPTHLFAGCAPKTDLTARVLPMIDEKRRNSAVEKKLQEQLSSVYNASSRDRNGFLDRGKYMWDRVRKPRGKDALGVGFENAKGELEAYVYFIHGEADDEFYEVIVKDAVARTPRGYDAIVRYLADQRSCGRTVVLRLGPSDPLLMRLGEPQYEEFSKEDWMVRVLDVERALASRGYSPIARASLNLEVRDALLGENEGAYTLAIDGGKGTVKRLAKKPSGRTSGGVSLDVGMLAPLFTGYLSATRLRALGYLEGDDASVRSADAIFAGGMPSMCEMF